MLPSYEILSKSKSNNVCVNVGEISRSSTWETESPALSRTTTWKKPNDFDISVREISRSSTWKTETPEILAKARRGRRSWTWAIISQVIGVLWLAPMTSLLILNFKEYVIGASVWCPRGRCSSDFLNQSVGETMAKANQLDREDHDVIGALQFVSKALEVWFMFISTSLIYDVAMLFAKKGGGLPVGFLLTHLEFSDIRYILSPLLWTSPIPHPSGTRKRGITAKLYLFVLLAASLTLLTNLMGPATAVLVIPTLQWIETPHRPRIIFNGTDAEFGPVLEDTFPGCTPKDYDNSAFSCTFKSYGSSMDAYAMYVGSITEQTAMVGWTGRALPTLSQESAVQYALNNSDEGGLTWVPNRQVLRDLTDDILALQFGVLNEGNIQVYHDPDAWRYNNSLQTILHRQGLSFGFESSCYLGNRTTIKVDLNNSTDDREVICYSGWGPGDRMNHGTVGWNDEGTYTKCFMSGFDWPEALNDQISFNLGDADSKKGQASVNYYFSTSSTYFNGTVPCLAKDSKTKCDWEDLLTRNLHSSFHNLTRNSIITEYKAQHPTTPNERRWCDSHVYLNFPTYIYDTNMISNSLNLVQMNNLSSVQSIGDPQILSLSWVLAAWSIDDGGTVSHDRPVVKQMLKTLPAAYVPDAKSIDWQKTDSEVTGFKLLHDYTLAQTLSFITFIDGNATNATEVETMGGPIFDTYAALHVWAYGLSDSTSKVGVAVAFVGCICVLVRLALAIAYKFRHEHSSVELFVAALNHKSQGEFEGLGDEQELAKVRYEMVEDEDGRPMFVPEKRQNSWESPRTDTGHWGWNFKRG